MTLITRRTLNRTKMLEFLGELEKSPGDEARSLYLPPHTEIETTTGKGIPEEISKVASSSRTGAALFLNADACYLVLPPFPIMTRSTVQGLFTEPLRSLLQRDYRIGLVLVRLGAYAIGVSDGEKLVSSKVGTGLVHGRHKQGGSSQARFRRHREKQIEYFLTRVCQHAREQLEPQAKTLDYVVYGGAWTTILLLKKQCPFLLQFDERALPPLLDIPQPRQVVLESAVNRVWSSTVFEWREG